MTVQIANLILTAISTAAAVVSAYAAISAKHEVSWLKNQISGNNNAQNSGKVNVENNGENQGVMSGVNTGDIRQ